MNIILNGQSKDIQPGTSIEILIKSVSKDASRVICELDGKIIVREQWPTTILSAKSQVELVTFVGGG